MMSSIGPSTTPPNTHTTLREGLGERERKRERVGGQKGALAISTNVVDSRNQPVHIVTYSWYDLGQFHPVSPRGFKVNRRREGYYVIIRPGISLRPRQGGSKTLCKKLLHKPTHLYTNRVDWQESGREVAMFGQSEEEVPLVFAD